MTGSTKSPQKVKDFKPLVEIENPNTTIMKDDVKRPTETTKIGNAPNPDEIPCVLELNEEQNLDSIVALFNRIYRISPMPGNETKNSRSA